MDDEKIRVLVVDDTVTYRKVVSDVLKRLDEVEVVGTAANGRIALQKIEQLQPDLITLDWEMPDVDGLGVLRQLKASRSPVGVIMLSAFTAEGARATMCALQNGAFDFVLKPSGRDLHTNADRLQQELRPRIQAFARKHRIQNILHHQGSGSLAGDRRPAPVTTPTPPRCHERPVNAGPAEVIALGISTGGPPALNKMLPMLPGDLSIPILIVQHMPPVFTKSLADDLNRRCALTVEEAVDGQEVRPGHVLIAPGGKQMKVERNAIETTIRITDDPPENSCKPSVDYLFRSVTRAYGSRAIGVIMTGMGNDGSRGCRQMKQRGATIIAQDEATCVVFGMPKEPVEEGVADVVAPLDRIASEIIRLAGRRKLACT